MSRTEVHKGRAIPLDMDLKTFLDKRRDLVDNHYKDQIESNPLEVFYNGLICGYEKYVLINNLVYELDNTQLDEYGFAVAERDNHDIYHYVVSFYNGGCSLQEAIQDAVRNTN